MTDGDPPRSLDLTPEQSPAALALPETPKYDPSADREKLRGKIALSLIWILGFIVASMIIFSFFHPSNATDAEKSLLDELLAPVVGLVGAVTGFYFGEKSR